MLHNLQVYANCIHRCVCNQHDLYIVSITDWIELVVGAYVSIIIVSL